MIQIKSEGISSNGTQILTESGETVHGVTGLSLRFQPDAVVVADLSIAVFGVDVQAHPLLDLASLEEAAAAHGYRLVKS